MAEIPHFDLITIVRHFDADRTAVFAAFADRETYARWACPAPGIKTAVNPFRFEEGGEALTVMNGDDMPEFINHDRFEEIIPNERIVQLTTLRAGGTLDFAGVVTLHFAEDGSGTLLTMTEQGVYPLDPQSPNMHQKGWNTMFDNLALVLKKTD